MRKEYYLKHKRERAIYHKQWRINHTDKVKGQNKRYYLKHKEKAYMNYHNIYRKEYRNQFKARVLTHYGNGKLACVICGESRLACLSIDHINNNGYQHRKEIRAEGGGNRFYEWLEKNNYPAGYQTLCMNDQFIKRDMVSKSKEE